MRLLWTSLVVWLVSASLMTLSEPQVSGLTRQVHAQDERIGQMPQVNYLQSADSPPGAVSAGRLIRGGKSTASTNRSKSPALKSWKWPWLRTVSFLHPLPAPVKVGMMVGAVYRCA